MNLLKFAAIDIGSNAIRLLFMNVFEHNGKATFKKSSLIRVPIRLGKEAFSDGAISERSILKVIDTMRGFSYLIKVHEPESVEICATAAMREASNSIEIIDRVRFETGLEIEVIDGHKEANIIFSTHVAEALNVDTAYLYVDVGGGSTEINLFSRKKSIETKSFNIGTLRLLNQQVDPRQWKEMKAWLKEVTKGYKPLELIGSGGNINKLYKLAGYKNNQSMTYIKLRRLKKEIEDHSYESRIELLGLNPDRADVIVPASEIFINIMKWSGAHKVLVPQIGLSDGLIHMQYQKYRKNVPSEELQLFGNRTLLSEEPEISGE